jgi:exodeoxyribonuclease VII large subunit
MAVGLRSEELRRVEGFLKALNPTAVMARGYSITTDASGRVLRSTAGLLEGGCVSTRLASGRFDSVVRSVVPAAPKEEEVLAR